MYRRVEEEKNRKQNLEMHASACVNTTNRIEQVITAVVNSRDRKECRRRREGCTPSIMDQKFLKVDLDWEKRIQEIEKKLSSFRNCEDSTESQKIGATHWTMYDSHLSRLARKTEALFRNATDTLDNQKTIDKDLEQSLNKLNVLVGNVESLKVFVERNIRIRSDAESLVKEQVSLITKQVCIEMRKVTTKILQENSSRIGVVFKRHVQDYEDDLAAQFHEEI